MLADDILAQLVAPFALEDEVAHISGSIGIAFFPDDGESVDELASKADSAIYSAKKEGGNCYFFYSPTAPQTNDRASRTENCGKKRWRKKPKGASAERVADLRRSPSTSGIDQKKMRNDLN